MAIQVAVASGRMLKEPILLMSIVSAEPSVD
jgi:hypothetical protein